ncbi:MAG TPA: hypothetical protein VI197_18295 [Polyangiaceae bacterium]
MQSFAPRTLCAWTFGASLGVLFIPAPALAQPYDFELTPHIGYTFGGGTEVEASEEMQAEGAVNGELDIASAPSFGATFSSRVHGGGYGELSYSRQQTNLGLRAPGTPREELFDMSVEYFQIGGLMDFRATDYSRLAPFFMMTLGATRFAADDYGDEWRFSVVLGAGVKIAIVDRFGIRLQGRFLSTFLSSESTIFCPGNGECLFVVGDTTATFQGEASLGAYVAF